MLQRSQGMAFVVGGGQCGAVDGFEAGPAVELGGEGFGSRWPAPQGGSSGAAQPRARGGGCARCSWRAVCLLQNVDGVAGLLEVCVSTMDVMDNERVSGAISEMRRRIASSGCTRRAPECTWSADLIGVVAGYSAVEGGQAWPLTLGERARLTWGWVQGVCVASTSACACRRAFR